MEEDGEAGKFSMKVERTIWKPEADIESSVAIVPDVTTIAQPGFGIQVIWNDPTRLWQPIFIVTFWRWRLSIGWLYD
jgi:hypothetical protein